MIACDNFFSLDSLRLYRITDGVEEPIQLTKKGIAWWTDKNVKFKNPVGNTSDLSQIFKGNVYFFFLLILTDPVSTVYHARHTKNVFSLLSIQTVGLTVNVSYIRAFVLDTSVQSKMNVVLSGCKLQS